MATSLSQDSQIRECRICLQVLQDLEHYHLFKPCSHPWDKEDKLLADHLSCIANIEVLETDPNKDICELCHTRLLDACCLVHTAQISDGILRQKYSSWPQPIQVDKNVDSMFGIQIKEEVVDDDYETYNATPSTEFQPDLMDIKIEPEEFTEPVTQNHCSPKIDEDKSATANGPDYTDVEYLDVVAVKEEPLEVQVGVPPKLIPLDCLLCSKEFNSVSGLRAHVIAIHSYKTVKRKATGSPSPVKQCSNDKHVCITCKRKFTTQTELLVHSTCHYKEMCYGCNANFETFEKLFLHRRHCKKLPQKKQPAIKTLSDVIRVPPPKDQPEEESCSSPVNTGDNNELKCKLCVATFSHDYYLKIHMDIQHCEVSETEKHEDLNVASYKEHQEVKTFKDDSENVTNDISILSDKGNEFVIKSVHTGNVSEIHNFSDNVVNNNEVPDKRDSVKASDRCSKVSKDEVRDKSNNIRIKCELHDSEGDNDSDQHQYEVESDTKVESEPPEYDVSPNIKTNDCVHIKLEADECDTKTVHSGIDASDTFIIKSIDDTQQHNINKCY